jgi:hypothetical protein
MLGINEEAVSLHIGKDLSELSPIVVIDIEEGSHTEPVLLGVSPDKHFPEDVV